MLLLAAIRPALSGVSLYLIIFISDGMFLGSMFLDGVFFLSSKEPSINDVNIKGGRGVSQMQTAADKGSRVDEMRMCAFWKILPVHFLNCPSRELFIKLNPGDMLFNNTKILFLNRKLK